MKKLFYYLTAIIILTLSSCDLFNKDDNDLGGDTNIPLNQVGNTFGTSGFVNGTYLDVDATIEITQSKDGVANLHVVADFTKNPELSKINDLIPSIYKDQEGKVNTDMKYKITSEGVQDYANLDQKPFMMVKYDCNVGDKYTLTKSDGKTITRTVTAKSTEDDFYWGFLLIKTITVEQDSRIPGISKFVYRFNHKFGMVYAEAVAEDGSVAGTYIYPANY